jgi:YD repeat-containing protein
MRKADNCRLFLYFFSAWLLLQRHGFGASFTYTYDPLNRLTNATYSDGSAESYSYDAAGNRLSQSYVAATIQADTNPPSTPTNLVTANLTTSGLSITWVRATDTGGSGLAGYRIYANNSLIGTTSSTNFAVTGLLPNSQYCFTITAFDHDGNVSAASQPVCFTTPAILPAPQLAGISISNGLVLFGLYGLGGTNYAVLASSNLLDWNSVLTNNEPAGGLRLIDIPVPANQPQMFYRAQLLTQGAFILQPGPTDSKDIWTTSVFAYSSCTISNKPGGGANDYRLRIGGYGDLYYTLIQFDLTALPTNAASAVLYLYCNNLTSGGTLMYLDRITSPWDWRTNGTGCDRLRLWWADKPFSAQWTTNQLAVPVLGQWYSVDITSLYNAWQSGTYPNYGLQFRPVSFNNNNFDEFYSADYVTNPILRPKLVVTPAN